ncbi:MAG: DUF1653 domain-containing protein [Ruminococcaceae bacterium]|nr:DUF1653 domain-containing protein [Oscillospiraceae bacterium]
MERGIYRHYKGNEYEFLFIAKHSETLEELVVYKALYNDSIWARPIKMWDEEIKLGDKTVKRFEFVRKI